MYEGQLVERQSAWECFVVCVDLFKNVEHPNVLHNLWFKEWVYANMFFLVYFVSYKVAITQFVSLFHKVTETIVNKVTHDLRNSLTLIWLPK